MSQSEVTHQIAMSFSPPVVGCLLKKKTHKRRVTGTPETPPPLATPLNVQKVVQKAPLYHTKLKYATEEVSKLLLKLGAQIGSIKSLRYTGYGLRVSGHG